MSFKFTVLPDERFIHLLQQFLAHRIFAIELRDHFGWKPDP